jgi:PEP-CTERM motif
VLRLISSTNRKSSFSTVAALLAVCACINVSTAHADLLPSPFLPLTTDQINSNNAFIGGTFQCTTDGSYDATTFALALNGDCPTTALQYDDGTLVNDVMIQANLTGLVDNNGDVIGGTFSLTGVMAGLGINVPTLLATGTLFDIEYGATASGFATLQTLIELDFVVGALAGLGDLLYWSANTNIGGWFGGGGVGEWEVSVDPSDFNNFTGSQYFFLDKSVVVPEPGILALFGIGLFAMGLSRRRKTV